MFQVNENEHNGLERIEDQSLTERVVGSIRSAIIQGQLSEGMHLSEADLAESLGVSRSPVREALRQLSLEGLVVTQRNRGTFVREYSAEDIDEIFLLRASLESLCMESR